MFNRVNLINETKPDTVQLGRGSNVAGQRQFFWIGSAIRWVGRRNKC